MYYISSAILTLFKNKEVVDNKTIGIIGIGNVGAKSLTIYSNNEDECNVE